jgi:hypothetical protein
MGLNMGGSRYISGGYSGFQYAKNSNNLSETANIIEAEKKVKERDSDLIIEDNTIYEIDRDCYERLKKLKKGSINSSKNTRRSRLKVGISPP